MKDWRTMADLDAITTMAPFEIRPGARVLGIDGELGQVSRAVHNPDGGDLAGLMLHRSFPLDREIAIPIALVESAAGDLVRLRLTLDELDEYRDDDQITDAVLDLLWYRSDMPDGELHYVKIQTTDGIVDLSGNSRTEQGRQAIVTITRGMHGVLGVRDHIRSLEALSEAARPFEHVRTPEQHRVGSE
jgi:hypothetical protein